MKTSNGRRGILVIQSMGLGDLLFSIPALRVLKRTFPDDPITFVTNRLNASLLSLVPEVAVTFSDGNKTLPERVCLIRQIRSRRCRMAVVLNPVFRGSILAWLAGIPTRIGYQRDYERKQSLYGLGRLLLTHAFLPMEHKMHEVDRYLGLLEQLGWSAREEERIPRLSIEARRSNNRRVTLHPGAGWEMKRWPEERFARLADWLVQDCGVHVSLVGGPEEQTLVERIRNQMRAEADNLAGSLTLPQLAEHLAGAELFIGNDTGTLHLAAAVGIPVIGLFGPGDSEKFRPLSHEAKILHHPVPWGPCRVQYTRRCENNLCMKEITVEEVWKAASGLLASRGFPCKEIPLTDPPILAPNASPPKKILYLQSTAEISGTDITLLRTVEALDRTRFEPHIVLHQEGPFAQAYRDAGCRMHILSSMRQWTLHRGWRYWVGCLLGYPVAVVQIIRVVRREKIDLIHTNTIHNPYGFTTALFSRVPHVWHIREIVVQSAWLRRLETRLVRCFSRRFVVMDNAIAEMFLKPGGGLPKNIVKLYDGVDLTVFHPALSGSRIRRELGLSEQIPLIGCVGRLDPSKGSDLFLEIAARVLKEKPDCLFWLCGGEIRGHAGLETALRRKAEQLGIQKQVLFTGWRYCFRDIPEVYGAMDVSLQCPLYPEPYGLANVEAMACGVPIVAVARGGPTELCVDGETALLVPPRDPRAAAQAVLSLLKNPDRARTMGMAGRSRAEKFFDRRQCVKKLEALYEELLTGKGS